MLEREEGGRSELSDETEFERAWLDMNCGRLEGGRNDGGRVQRDGAGVA